MAWAVIHKSPATGVEPNVVDYEDAVRRFTWAGARTELDGLPGGSGLNIAHEAVDRQAAGPSAAKVALRCIDRAGARRSSPTGRSRTRPTASPRCSGRSASSPATRSSCCCAAAPRSTSRPSAP